jgi:hypothetical protein
MARASILVWTAFLLIGSCQHCPAQSTEQLPDFYGYEVVAEYAHDPYAFTQGAILLLCFLMEPLICAEHLSCSQACSLTPYVSGPQEGPQLAKRCSGSQQVCFSKQYALAAGAGLASSCRSHWDLAAAVAEAAAAATAPNTGAGTLAQPDANAHDCSCRFS